MEKKEYEMPVLNSYLLKNIIFSMENQSSIGYLDLECSEIVEINSINDSVIVKAEKNSDELISIKILKNKDRFLALPPWGSIEGFKIREQFIKDMKNPVYKKHLDHVFHTGRGVFRKFKEVLKENPIIERQWLDYKSKYMKAVVINWYKECEGYINLVNLEEEIEELPNDLLVSDFLFSTDIDKTVIKDVYLLKEEMIKELNFFEKLIITRRDKLLSDQKYLVSYDLEDNLVGYIEWEAIDSSNIEIISYGVKKEYRGLGLFNLMLDKLIRQAARERYDKVVMYKTENLINFTNSLKNKETSCNFGYTIIDINYWNMSIDSSELLDV